MRAVKFFASLRLDIRRRDTYTEGSGDNKITYGHKMRVRIRKNKVGTAGRVALVDLYYDSGFDKIDDMIKAGVRSGVIEKNGGWLTYQPLGVSDEYEIKDNGQANFLEAIKKLDNPELMLQEMREVILGTREEPLYYAESNDETKEGKDVDNNNDQKE